MKDTVLGIQFDVNDLASSYEVAGTSDNYSFQYDLGKGSDLVNEVGDQAQKAVSLKGNYGDFTVRVFAVSNIGIRSQFIETGIRINPQEFDGTFKFANIGVSNLPEDAKIGSTVIHIPSGDNNTLMVNSEFVDRNPRIDWALEAPLGHSLEGQALGPELLGDSLFDKFSVSLKTGENAVELTSLQLDSSFGLMEYLNSSEVSAVMSNYSGFSFQLNDSIFKELGDNRTFVLEVVGHDFYGKTCTGILSGTNYDPVINLTNDLDGSSMEFAWSNNDSDPDGVIVHSLSYPSGVELSNPHDIFESRDYFKESSEAGGWSRHINYMSGNYAKYNSDVYKCVSGYIYSNFHQVRSNLTPPSNQDVWENFGQEIDWSFNSLSTKENNISIPQAWGRCYSYTFVPSDLFGTGHIYNMTENSGLARDARLAKFRASVEVANLRFRERGDDLIFDWEIVNQDGEAIDLGAYKYLTSQFKESQLLGLSGSLFDASTEMFLTGITQGQNSSSYTYNDDGQLEKNSNLPSTTDISTYAFTREINNYIYGTGGWIPAYAWSSQNYVEDSLVLDGFEGGKSIKWRAVGALSDFEGSSRTYRPPPFTSAYVKPVHESWDVSGEYAEGDVVEYDGSLYLANYFVEDTASASGIYNENINYPTGVLVMSPEDPSVDIFNISGEYIVGDRVLWRGTVYEANRSLPIWSGAEYYPNQYVNGGSDSWDAVPVVSEENFGIYLSVEPNGPPYSSEGTVLSGVLPSTGSNHWKHIDPFGATGWGVHVSGYTYSSQWSGEVDYASGSIVSYNNDLWSGVRDSGPNTTAESQPPVEGADPNQPDTYWTESGSFAYDPSNDIILSYAEHDTVLHDGVVYRANISQPTGAPSFSADENSWEAGTCDTSWSPIWETVVSDLDFVYGHWGIRESGKRSVGIELGIVDTFGEVVQRRRLVGQNPPPIIMQNGFSVDSLSKTETVRFDFRYAFGRNEKTSKVELYRSSTPSFDVTGEDGLVGTGAPSFVHSILGAAEATLGENINQISDSPPVPLIDGYGHQVTGYYYKILPYDAFGSGEMYEVSDDYGDLERVLIYPKNFHSRFGDGFSGPVLQRSAGDLPGVPVNFAGKTAFETYFLSWEVPYSGDEAIDIDLRASNISHYELWESHEDEIKIAGGLLTQENNLTGHRRIYGDLPSVGAIPTELLDPALGITNATNSANVDAASPYISLVHRGDMNDKRYFWVRSVDKAGNKGPFTGSKAGDWVGDNVKGLELTLGQVTTTDISDFEQNITKTFPNTLALVPSDPFRDNSTSSKNISWDRHFVYLDGTGYVIGPGTTDDGGSAPFDTYVYWQGSTTEVTSNQLVELGLTGAGGGAIDNTLNNPLRNIVYSGDYLTSERHPAGGGGWDAVPGFTGGDHIIARNTDGIATPMWHAFANALIGTAHIENAAIINAKVNDMSADKITAGTIYGHDLQIGQDSGGGFGKIRSHGFTPEGTGVTQGFVISGDGSFMFKDDKGGIINFGDEGLLIQADLRLKGGKSMSLVNLYAEPNVFKYTQNIDDTYSVDSPATTELTAHFQNINFTSATDVLWRIENGAGTEYVGYDTLVYGGDGDGTYGFSLDSWDNSTQVAIATLKASGFDGMVGAAYNNLTISVSGRNQSAEHTITLFKNKDGEQGDTGRHPVYRGPWSASADYSGAHGQFPLRADVIKQSHAESEYWMALTDHTSSNFTTEYNAGYWAPFGNQFNNDFAVDSLGVGTAPSGTIGSIIATNDIVAYASSDERLKDDISPIESAMDKVRSISGVKFRWNENAYSHLSGPDVGVIAQQVQKVLPEAVREREDGYLAVRYEKIVPLLIEAIKEQDKKISELNDKLKD